MSMINYIRLISVKLLVEWSNLYNTFGRKETWLRRQELELESKRLQQEGNQEGGREKGLEERRDRWTTIRRISLLCNESLFEKDVEGKRKTGVTIGSKTTTTVRHGGRR